MPITTYKFKCEYHHAVLTGEPQFVMTQHDSEWSVDLSEMECPAMAPLDDKRYNQTEYDKEWQKCVDSWNIYQVQRSGNLTVNKELGGPNAAL